MRLQESLHFFGSFRQEFPDVSRLRRQDCYSLLADNIHILEERFVDFGRGVPVVILTIAKMNIQNLQSVDSEMTATGGLIVDLGMKKKYVDSKKIVWISIANLVMTQTIF